MADERVEFELLGQRLAIRSEASPEYVQKLVDYLGEKLRMLEQGSQMREPVKLSILAALHITDEHFKSREQSADLPADAGDRIQALVKILNDALPLSLSS
jgi:cell division protein ZapA (FtsZ GTPase activity inhibitor)